MSKQLKVLINNNERVLTTKQLAEVYETEENNIVKNLSRNTDRFIEGKHYYKLKGEELKEFKNLVTDSHVVDKRTPSLILWTEKGANRMCKILDTDKAWEQFEMLEETYFRVKEIVQAKQRLDSYMIEDPIKRAERWIEEHQELEQERTLRSKAEAVIKEQQPKVEYYDKVMSGDHLITTTCIAKSFGITAKELNEILKRYGLIFKQGKTWYLRNEWADKNIGKLIPVETKGGVVYQLRWTEKGKKGIYGLLKQIHYVEVATINTEAIFGE